ncbi:hypothetical protein NG798_03195 [Ancylothrix sp. C2]|nr:hypothetical protein [Ancylothrix sp. D3o]
MNTQTPNLANKFSAFTAVHPTKVELTDEIIRQISTLGNLYCLDLIKRAVEAEIVIKSDCQESDELFDDLE